MSRIVFWVALIILVGFAVRAKWRAATRRSEERMPPRTAASNAGAIENMTSCAHCGLHFPASETSASPTGCVFVAGGSFGC